MTLAHIAGAVFMAVMTGILIKAITTPPGPRPDERPFNPDEYQRQYRSNNQES